MKASSGLTSRPDPNARSPRYGPISSPSTGILFQQEIALFKSELHKKLASLGTGAGPTAAGGLGAFSGWLALLAAAHHASPLDCQRRRYRNRAGLLWIGKSRLGADPLVPRRTLNLLRADQAWSRIRLRAKGNHMDTENPKPGSNVSSVGDMLQANWIPLSLIGVGITWLVASNTGLAERIAKDKRVQTAGSRIGEIAGDLGIGGGTKHEPRQTGQILGTEGRPLSSGDTGVDEGWVTQATGAARSAIISVRDAGSAVIDRASRYADNASGASDMAIRAGQLVESSGAILG